MQELAQRTRLKREEKQRMSEEVVRKVEQAQETKASAKTKRRKAKNAKNLMSDIGELMCSNQLGEVAKKKKLNK